MPSVVELSICIIGHCITRHVPFVPYAVIISLRCVGRPERAAPLQGPAPFPCGRTPTVLQAGHAATGFRWAQYGPSPRLIHLAICRGSRTIVGTPPACRDDSKAKAWNQFRI